jgi:hypothetical protein
MPNTLEDDAIDNETSLINTYMQQITSTGSKPYALICNQIVFDMDETELTHLTNCPHMEMISVAKHTNNYASFVYLTSNKMYDRSINCVLTQSKYWPNYILRIMCWSDEIKKYIWYDVDNLRNELRRQYLNNLFIPISIPIPT